MSPDCQHVTIETYTTGENPYLNQSITYTYDDLYRLTDAEYEEVFSVDEWRNGK